jgi:sugar (pentulose or hexulose) kinase
MVDADGGQPSLTSRRGTGGSTASDRASSAMTRVRNVAVIDIGKTNAKLALVDLLELREIDVCEIPNTVLHDEPYPHHDTEALWDFLIEALGRVQARHGVDAVTATTHGAAAVLLDKAGELVVPMLDYEHDGPDAMAAEYDALRPDFALSGAPRLPRGFNLGAQLHWLLSTRPELRHRLAYVVTYPQYWVGRLTGTWCTEVTSLGCHTDLWLPREGRLSDLVEKLGLSAQIPPVRKAGDLIGTLLPEVAQETGLSQATPVYCGIHDSNASLYPHLLGHSAPFSVLSTGTWVITMAVGGKPQRLDPTRDTLMNVSAFGDPVPSARFMGGREFEMLTHGAPLTPTEDDIATVLMQGVTLSPAVVPTSGPFQGRQAEWSVPKVRLHDGERTVVISLYLAMMALTCLELTGAEGPILTEGPFAKNTLFLDLVAAASGRQVMSSTGSATGTSIGAALLAAEDARMIANHSRHPSPQGAYRNDLVRYAEQWRLLASS